MRYALLRLGDASNCFYYSNTILSRFFTKSLLTRKRIHGKISWSKVEEDHEEHEKLREETAGHREENLDQQREGKETNEEYKEGDDCLC